MFNILAIKEMQIKTTLRLTTLLLECLSSRTQTTSAGKDVRGKGTLIHCWYELVRSLWLLKKLKVELPYDPKISLLGIYPKECKSGYNKGTWTPMFTVAFSQSLAIEIAKMPTTDEWIKEMWCLYPINKF
jgi:hypothetical protein